MNIATKIAAKDSCNYALNKGNSNETNIKISADIAKLFGHIPTDGESYDVSFMLSKNDFLVNLCKIMSALPLYSSKGEMVHFSDTLFNEKLQEINLFFGDEKNKSISAKLSKPNKHPYCLNFGPSKFSIRDFLVENRSVLTFSESNGKIKLNIKYDIGTTQKYKETSFCLIDEDRQQIYYGAPGTGKSHTIKEQTTGQEVIRTTFHPDTDYSSFVGSYKPTTVEETVMTVIGTKAVPVENPDGSNRTQTKITYEFVSQAFLKAYINAWKMYAKVHTKGNESIQPQFLIIEEINRGNCAQIFGDLFQLLDRNQYGFSDYPIEADADMHKYLKKSFEGINIPLCDSINNLYDGKDVVSEILEGQILLLPNNLYIWATMNTNDQSLFPIDSAFKRRWDWKYIPISNAHKDWVIEVNGNQYDWWGFVEKINSLIGITTYSEDKKLGYFFCKAQDNVISAEKFVGKVIFYLWNDVFKDYEFADQAFDDHDDNEKLTFDKFYTSTHSKVDINENKVEMFFKNLGLTPLNHSNNKMEKKDTDEFDEQQDDSSKSFTLDGKPMTLKEIAKTVVSNYCKAHPDKSSQDIKDLFVSECKGSGISHIVETEDDYVKRSHQKSVERSVTEIILLNDEKIYVTTQWRAKNPGDNFFKFIDIVHKNGWGVIKNIIRIP